ncbi:MAG TPA: PVC-type heme-binding CxxCH protein [Verrucomicrobiales bacterium]|nr:PVC-type heme-binding CxxCH protein [Verrucomicrobiales bacterium]
MNRRLLLTSLPLFSSALLSPARELEGVYKPAQNQCPSVEEAIAKMKVPDGYEVRNFASEPMIVNPVAMTWDHRGRLWAVELYEYPRGAKTPNEYSKTATDEKFRPVVKTDANSPRDKVVILEDTDNDGKADKRTVFAEGLNLATAVLVGYDGVFVGQAPNLFYFRDTNGDDKADQYKTVLTGFGLEDRHELLNSFCWGPEGYMYFTHGVFTHSKVRRPSEPKDQGNTLNAGIYRVKFAGAGNPPHADKQDQTFPLVTTHEVYSDGTSNPWGVDFDARGNAFVEACVIDHLFHMAPGGMYQRQGGAPENPYGYELLPSIVNHKHFRAAYAGIQIYQGGIYPADTHGHAFFGNIHDNSIHEESLTPAGATFKSAPVRDFLRANDGWFRPVSTQTGPDGFLWVMDWCDKYPCYQNAQANPEGVDREKGRIWRICYTGSEEGKKMAGRSRESAELNVMAKSATERKALAEHRNNWVRRMAASFEHKPMSIAEATAAAKSDNPGTRQTAARWAGEFCLNGGSAEPNPWQESYPPFLIALAADPDAGVRHAAAVATRQWGYGRGLTVRRTEAAGPDIEPLLTALMRSSKDADRTLAFGIWMAMESELSIMPERYLPWLAGLALETKPLSQILTYKTARRITDTRKSENMDLLLAFLDKVKGDDVLTAHGLDGMLKAQEAGALKPAKADPAALFAHWQKSKDEKVRNLAGRLATLWGDPNAIASIMGTVLDQSANLQERIEAVRTVRRLKSDAARTGILKLLESKSPDNLTVEVLRAAGELGGLDLANAILKAWQNYSPALKTAAAEVLVTRKDWAARLLDGVEGKWVASGKISGSDIPVSVRRSFAQNNDLKARAQQLLGAWNESTADVKKLIAAKRKAALTGEPNLASGKIMFTVTCGTCHKFHGGGQEVGPELIGNGRSSLDSLLNNVIDPNQVIGNGYENFTVTTKDGRTLAGRVIEDTPTQMTLLGLGGVRTVVPRGDIKDSVNSHQSLMPMSFGELPDDVFRDLIWYVLAPPEEGPLTKEKKAALAAPVTDTAPPPAPPADGVPRGAKVDWESVSLWNPDWKVTAPEFEGTPHKLAEYQGRKNVLMIHPFEDRKTPAKLTRELTLPADKSSALKFAVASHDKGDWELRVTVNGKEAKRQTIGHEGERWTKIEIDLSSWKGRKVALSLENHATEWMYEFSYWSNVRVE